MVEKNKYLHGVWRHYWLFIGATLVCCAGLGVLWVFPPVVAAGHGGVVVAFYLLFLLLLGWPLLLTEVALGRRARQSAIGALRFLARESGRGGGWRVIGWLATLAGLLTASWAVPLAAWSARYFVDMATGTLQGQNLNRAAEHFQALQAKPAGTLLECALLLLLTGAVLAGGLPRIARTLRHLAAILGSLLALALLLSVTGGAWPESYRHLYDLDWPAPTGPMFWQGAGQGLSMAFVTLVLGAGVMVSFGAYTPSRKPSSQSSSAAGVTLLIALLAGLLAMALALVLLAVLYAVPGMEWTSGRDMMFVSLPASFSNMENGLFLGALFFLLALLAVWGAAISLLEPTVAWLVESTRCNRRVASLLAGSVAMALVPGSLYSYGLPFDYGVAEAATRLLILPVGGLLMALFVGWGMGRPLAREVLYDEPKWVFAVWHALLRYVAPLAMVIIIAFGLYGLSGSVEVSPQPQPLFPK